MPHPTAISAPGKVFLAGGYLVLDRAYTALVFGLSARIHVLVEDRADGTATGLDGDGSTPIVVRSPQFVGAVWEYAARVLGEEGGVEVKQVDGSSSGTASRNPFVETALGYALTYIHSVLPPTSKIKPTSITILADDDYYSQPTPTQSTPSTSPTPRFTDFGVPLSAAHKTGLGSSAALVTAFTAALLTHYLPPSLFSLSSTSPSTTTTPDPSQHRLHNLSQLSHCAAQGKIGSGFDIATAVFGSCIYRRFSPSLLGSLSPGPSFSTRVRALVNDDPAVWDVEITEGVGLPQGYALVMCDVDCGSETVGMVKGVLAWKARDGEGAKRLMDGLQGWNERLGEALGKGDVGGVRTAFGEMRGRIREMGERSGVPIEPREQTELLDALGGVEGVVGGVVPGAGGYDAVVLLVKDDEGTKKGIEEFLEKWSKEKGGNVKLLKTRGEVEGARVEDGDSYLEFR